MTINYQDNGADTYSESPHKAQRSNSNSGEEHWTDKIGHKIRQRRKIKRASLKDIAQDAEISIGQLSQIERGLSAPTLKTVYRICTALDMPMDWLFDRNSELAGEGYIVRDQQKRKMDLGANGMLKYILSPDHISEIQLMRFILRPGTHSGVSPAQHPQGAKCGTVLAGALGLEIDGNKQILYPGDSFAFRASSNYQFWAHGDDDCEVIWAVTPAIY